MTYIVSGGALNSTHSLKASRYTVNDIYVYDKWWLVWRSGNGVRHIIEVKLRRARLVLGSVTTFGGSTTQAHSAWPSLRG